MNQLPCRTATGFHPVTPDYQLTLPFTKIMAEMRWRKQLAFMIVYPHLEPVFQNRLIKGQKTRKNTCPAPNAKTETVFGVAWGLFTPSS